MKNKFTADGHQRFLRTRKITTSSIEKKYADKIASAKPDELLKIKEQMAIEYRMIWNAQNHNPSAGTLW